jgi:hypothetical protein
MTGHELITASPTGHTSSEINLRWLEHFIKYNNCGPNEQWRLLVLDGAASHTDAEFITKAKANKVWPVMFPSHQTHLIQPADVGCFRKWKQYQHTTIWNAIRSYEPEYNVQSFFRDLPSIREQTFTRSTIKHAFRDARIWPLSWKAVEKKIIEYGKKKKTKNLGVNLLE